MSASDKKLANQLESDIYESFKLKKIPLVLLLFLCLMGSFLYYLPTKQILEAGVNKVLRANPQCAINYSQLKFSYLIPTINLTNPIIPGSCFQDPKAMLPLNHLALSLHMPSFSPPGPRLHLNAKKGTSVLNAYPVISWKEQTVRIDNTKLRFADFNEVAPELRYMSGTFQVTSQINLIQTKLSTADVLIESNDLKTTGLEVMGLQIPSMPFNHFLLRGNLDNKNTFHVKSLRLGDEKAPIQAQFAGQVLVNPGNPRYSRVDLTGELILTDKIMRDFPILIPMLQNKQKTAGGGYRIRLTGTFAQMNPPTFL